MRAALRKTAVAASGFVMLLALPALGVVAARSDEGGKSVDSGIREQTESYLSVLRLRIEPTRNASVGQCQSLGPQHLTVTVQDRTLSGSEALHLDRRRPPTLHALVVDNSASMVHDLEYAKFAAKEYVKQLQPDREKGLVMTFDENVVLLQAPTSDRQKLLEAVDRVRSGSRTSMLDAIYYSMEELDAHRERPVMILLTDGADTSSLHGVEDIESQVVARSDLTVFTIGLGLKTEDGVKPTRELLRRLAASTHGRFFEVTEGESLRKVFSQIRDILENEAILTVVDPDPGARRSRIRVESRDRLCTVQVLGMVGEVAAPAPDRQPIPRPYLDAPQSFEKDVDPGHYRALSRAGGVAVAPDCPAGSYFSLSSSSAGFRPKWFVHAGQRLTSGCGPDLTLDHGRLYEPASPNLFAHQDLPRLTARLFELPVPPFADLPRSPEEALDRLAATALDLADAEFPPESWVREGEGHAGPFQDYPSLVHGITFLGMRGLLARSQFLYPDYREWVLGRLRQQAEAELELLEQRYRAQFPHQPAEAIELAARHSPDGRRILAPAESPSDVDLQPYLSAWLGDISAHDLFRRWERLHVDRSISRDGDGGPVDRRFVEAWEALRRTFFAPSYARVLTMLVPVHDPVCDCVGFWRVVLPRPSWFKARVSGLTQGHELSGDLLDLVPPDPDGWLAVRRLVDEVPGLIELLGSVGYRAEEPTYGLLGDPRGHDPQGAFARSTVEIVLRGPGAAAQGADEVLLFRAEVARDAGGESPSASELVDLTIEATPTAIDWVMAEELRSAAKRILGVVDEPPADEASGPTEASVPPPAADAPSVGPSAIPSLPGGPSERETVVAIEVPVQVLMKGEPVRGLTAGNFELIDEGRERRITALEVVDLLDPSQSAGQAGRAELPLAARRHLMLLFDLSDTDPGPFQRARQAALDSLEGLHVTDRVAVASYTAERGARLHLDFTADREKLRAALEGLGTPLRIEGGSEDSVSAALGEPDPFGAGSRPSGSSTARDDSGDDAAAHFADVTAGMEGGQRRIQQQRVFSMCRDLSRMARWIARVPGRKQVVFLSEGFDRSLLFGTPDTGLQRALADSQEKGRIWEIDVTQRSGDTALQTALDAMLEEFRRADSVIQSIDVSSTAGRAAGTDGLHMLARGTGGELYRETADLTRSLRRMLDRTAFYYVLFFQPGETEKPGEFHKLKVKLADVPRGSRAVHRPGYWTHAVASSSAPR